MAAPGPWLRDRGWATTAAAVSATAATAPACGRLSLSLMLRPSPCPWLCSACPCPWLCPCCLLLLLRASPRPWLCPCCLLLLLRASPRPWLCPCCLLLLLRLRLRRWRASPRPWLCPCCPVGFACDEASGGELDLVHQLGLRTECACGGFRVQGSGFHSWGCAQGGWGGAGGVHTRGEQGS